MRRLAADLGVEAMSLYYHLPGKDGLLDGLVETVIMEIDAAISHSDAVLADGTAEDWRATLRRWFLAAREVMLRHAWAPTLMGRGGAIPASVYMYYEKILATLIGAGFSYRIAHRALHAFGSMPLGFVQEVFGPGAGDGNADDDEAELAAMAAALPHMTAMMGAELHAAADPTLGWCDSQVEFQFTLDLLLDGLERFRQSS